MAEIKIIQQAISEESLFRVLWDWCNSGAGKKSHSLKILTAFVSDKAIDAISPLLDVFLADGNHVEIIFGIDRGGTNREAINRLRALQTAHAQRITVSMFRAPAAGSIFHPKLYIYEAGPHISFVIGSANLTLPGLGSNLESLMLFENVRANSDLGKAALGIWSLFAEPRPPLPANALRALDQTLAKELLKELPEQSSQENKSGANDVEFLWSPLSKVPLSRSGVGLTKKTPSELASANDYLLMDILTESRETQVQFPLDVVEDFFRVPRLDEATLRVRVVADGVLTQPIERRLVISTGEEFTRNMRRLEMPQIKGLERTLAVLFFRLRVPQTFAYLVIPRHTRTYRVVDQILNEHGQQGSKKRRYYIRSQDETVWPEIKRQLIAALPQNQKSLFDTNNRSR